MSVNVQTLIVEVVKICEALSRATRQGQRQEVKHLWQELQDLRQTVAALEQDQPSQASTQEIDRLIEKIRPAYEYWCQQRGLTP